MNDLLYCIKCGKMELVQNSPWGILHSVEFYTDDGIWGAGWDMDWCFFDLGYATCPPPELEEDWELHVDEPKDEILLFV